MQTDNTTSKQFKPPCYQQGQGDCGYYCVKIAAEMLLQRRFTEQENQMFDHFKSHCGKKGEQIRFTTKLFNQLFPELPVQFEVEDESIMISPDMIRNVLDSNGFPLINIQRMRFHSDTITDGGQKNNDGHNVCVIGYDGTHFFIQDSNKYKGHCLKKLDISLVQQAYDDWMKIEHLNNLRLTQKFMNKRFYVIELIHAYKAKKKRKSKGP